MSLVSRQALRAMYFRHRFTLQDAGIGAAILAVCAFFLWQTNLFPEASEQQRRLLLEIDEGLALAALGFGLFAWSRWKAQQRELRRRIVAERRARTLAMEDPLTGLANRRQFDDCLAKAIAAPPRAGGAHAVLTLDLNGFKKVNDVHGHPAGDEVLIQVAGRLREAMREGDLVARLGGDEFAVLATHVVGAEAATGLARRIIDCLAEQVTTEAGVHAVGAAIGVALIPQDGDTPEEVLRRADIALYRAKAEGGSTLRFFEAEMDAQVRERDSLERELRLAVEANALQPHYQPLIDLKSGRIVGFEALARWTHPTLGEIGPDRFIAVAEDCGLIGAVTDRLLRQACRDAMAWPAEVGLSFNISPSQLRDAGLAERLLNILAQTGLAPTRLEIEITESALVRDLDAARRILGALREAGVRIALDDFGTGYSSLYHLRNFKLDKIKIDRSFVDAMAHDSESAAIVRALVGLGSGLSLTVTAEGVEDAEQQALLTEQGCDQAQGFLFSHAVAAEDALALLATRRVVRKGPQGPQAAKRA